MLSAPTPPPIGRLTRYRELGGLQVGPLDAPSRAEYTYDAVLELPERSARDLQPPASTGGCFFVRYCCDSKKRHPHGTGHWFDASAAC